MPRLVGLLVGALSVIGLIAACTGDDPSLTGGGESPDASSPPGRGDRGNPCYPNGTCNADLVCRAGVCDVAGGPPTGDGGGDPTIGDAGDAGDSGRCGAAIKVGAAGPVCGATTCTAGQCCSLLDSTMCSPNCTAEPFFQANDTAYTCTAPAHCPGEGPCCLDTAAVVISLATSCPALRLDKVLRTECGACAGGQALCANDADCPPPSTKCEPLAVMMGSTPVVLGLCL
jgi:hypothetical protein